MGSACLPRRVHDQDRRHQAAARTPRVRGEPRSRRRRGPPRCFPDSADEPEVESGASKDNPAIEETSQEVADRADRYAQALRSIARYLRENHLAVLSLMISLRQLEDPHTSSQPPHTDAERQFYEGLMRELSPARLDRIRSGSTDRRDAEHTPASRKTDETIAHTRHMEQVDPHLAPPGVG